MSLLDSLTKKEKQQAWFNSDEGRAFRERQSQRFKKFASAAEREAATNERKKRQRRESLEHNLRYRLRGCRARAKREGIPCDLTYEYLVSIYTDTCPYLGIKMNLMSTSGNSMDAMSIDKIVPELGYIQGNVQFVSYKANVMKQDVSIDTLLTFAKSVIRMHGE